MTTVSLVGMKFYAYHGYYPEERKIGNDFVLDVHVDVPQFEPGEVNIHDTVNYEGIYEICKKHMDKQYKLLESIAMEIGEEIKSRYTHVLKTRVNIAKLGPQLGGVVDKAVIEYTC